ncbi:hypothetical protein DL766_008149 [Monosporascus sp. MC13-8B]|uniref:Uncharacterized protein n=1 Tax=Monosporascus cannonballus TaxID=155416 RepID=A0ABY0GRE1_9PEZI|nr:hypothetical protein DL762_010285 [Monosporascus cannonballus]RYO81450.1 hypothetical protein DL763_008577 [Monosporascus cannonballus]RYP20598.1 hypothetical protein DL766_008149 [Monosporascus sp. MC13-8B]
MLVDLPCLQEISAIAEIWEMRRQDSGTDWTSVFFNLGVLQFLGSKDVRRANIVGKPAHNRQMVATEPALDVVSTKKQDQTREDGVARSDGGTSSTGWSKGEGLTQRE